MIEPRQYPKVILPVHEFLKSEGGKRSERWIWIWKCLQELSRKDDTQKVSCRGSKESETSRSSTRKYRICGRGSCITKQANTSRGSETRWDLMRNHGNISSLFAPFYQIVWPPSGAPLSRSPKEQPLVISCKEILHDLVLHA
jgi:hypothetical protein